MRVEYYKFEYRSRSFGYSPVIITKMNPCSGGSKGGGAVQPPTAQNFLNFMHFPENLAKSYVGTPGGLAPLKQEILDPPLTWIRHYSYTTSWTRGSVLLLMTEELTALLASSASSMCSGPRPLLLHPRAAQ